MTHARKQYRPRPLRYPMMAPLKQQISLDMHLALARLRTDPHDDARTDLASTFNTVGVAIENDKRFQEEVQHLNAGGAVFQAYVAPAALTDDQLAILAHTCAVIDTILGLLDVPTLWAAEKAAIDLLRGKETRARHAFTKDYMGLPARYIADAYGEAAAVVERRLDDLAAQRKGDA